MRETYKLLGSSFYEKIVGQMKRYTDRSFTRATNSINQSMKCSSFRNTDFLG